jgi:hypothetical protein
MAERPWKDSSVELRQFGCGPVERVVDAGLFRIIDEFRSVVASIQDAPDATLLRLHEHIFGAAAPSPVHGRAEPVAEDVWTADRFRLFVSHTSAHSADVGFLKLLLGSYWIDAFVAHEDIEPTRDWQGVIESALDTCEALLAWLTEDFHQSLWTDQEVGFCVHRSVLVIPVRRGLDPYGFIGKYQGVAGSGKDLLAIAEEVRLLLATHELTGTRMAARTVQSFAHVDSFKDARKTFEILKRIPPEAWTEPLLDEVARAAEQNDQITQAWETFSSSEMLPAAVERFVAEQRSRVTGTS